MRGSLFLLLLVLLPVLPASAQDAATPPVLDTVQDAAPSQAPPETLPGTLAAPEPEPATHTRPRVRAFADAGPEMFHAVDSFDAVFATTTGTRIGGGAAVALPWSLFADARLSRLRMTGERAFVFNGQRYPLGVKDTLTVMPLQITGGYRAGEPGGRTVTYFGAGIGWYHIAEHGDFSAQGDDVSKTVRGYHVLGGGDIRLWRFIGAGGEVEWSTVNQGLAGTGLASALKDTNLGGVTVRARLVVGLW